MAIDQPDLTGNRPQLPQLLRDLISASPYRHDIDRLADEADLPVPTVRNMITSPNAVGDWQHYRRLLDAVDAGSRTVGTAKVLWSAAGGGPVDQASWPAEATRDDEIRATDPAEFAELLALLRIRSGASVAKIGELAGIPRSQAYAMVGRNRQTLPRKADQVARFVRACGLDAAQTELVMRLWVRLTEATAFGQPPAGADTAADTTEDTPADVRPHRSSRPCWIAAVVGVGAAALLVPLPKAVRTPAIVVLVAIFIASVLVALASLPRFRMSGHGRRSGRRPAR